MNFTYSLKISINSKRCTRSLVNSGRCVVPSGAFYIICKRRRASLYDSVSVAAACSSQSSALQCAGGDGVGGSLCVVLIVQANVPLGCTLHELMLLFAGPEKSGYILDTYIPQSQFNHVCNYILSLRTGIANVSTFFRKSKMCNPGPTYGSYTSCRPTKVREKYRSDLRLVNLCCRSFNRLTALAFLFLDRLSAVKLRVGSTFPGRQVGNEFQIIFYLRATNILNSIIF